MGCIMYLVQYVISAVNKKITGDHTQDNTTPYNKHSGPVNNLFTCGHHKPTW